MHRLAAVPGGWDSNQEGVVFIEQTPAPIVVLTAADTDISVLAQTLVRLPNDFPDIRSVNLLQLQQQLTIDTYAEDILAHAEVIVLRLLGGRAYWSYGLEVVKAIADETGAVLVVIPGDERPDLDLMGHSSAPLKVVNKFWHYVIEGGIENWCNGLLFLSDRVLSTQYAPVPPQPVEKIGLYRLPSFLQAGRTTPKTNQQLEENCSAKVKFANKNNEGDKTSKKPSDIKPLSAQLNDALASFEKHIETIKKQHTSANASVGILFYRAHYLAGNTKPIDALCQALIDRNLNPVPIYVSSLKDIENQQALILQYGSKWPLSLLINTTSFAIASLSPTNSVATATNLWQTLDVPVLQAICSGSTYEHWQQHPQGLTPRDIAMNVALPEVDGRIVSRAVSFKSVQPAVTSQARSLQTDVVGYEPERDRIDFVADLAARWIHLRHTPPERRKVALILANYPNRDGRMANGVGLDTPASCLQILQALQRAGYTVSDLPDSSDELMQQLAQGITNDPEGYGLRTVKQSLPLTTYESFFEALPATAKKGISDRWGDARTEWQRFYPDGSDKRSLPVSGVQFGNVFVGIQPSRGYDIDPSLNYHAPDLEPTHAYLGFYCWVRQVFGADAVVHVGKHGNLEWLPGKGIALSSGCYPEVAFGPLPHFYPFIVNDPGEGAQAKRRSQAVILDHLTPPMTRAELYGPLQQLESLVDEYYEAQNLDPTRLPVIGEKILALLQKTRLQQDLSLEQQAAEPLQTWLPQIDGYLCELKEAQIRDGLHIFGVPPKGQQARDLIVAIARHPNSQHIGLSRAIAQAWNLDIDPLTADASKPFRAKDTPNAAGCRTLGDVIERIENYANHLVSTKLEQQPKPEDWPFNNKKESENRDLKTVLDWMSSELIPNLSKTTAEVDNLLHGLAGGYVPSGPSGAPTRNRPEVLPTGRNFYSVDIRAIPTESAWDVGRKAAEVLIENYTQENGEYPRTLGLSMWGTAAMRTGGDDMAEALALLGVRPVWDGPSRRVIDFEILPVSALGRPRVDVTLRISGFFRDAFPNLIALFDQAVQAVSVLDEPADQNPLAEQVQKDYNYWQQEGLDADQSLARSRYRVFGSKPGAYGAGLQGLIEAQNWESDADLARAYINWSSYAYAVGENGQANGHSAPEAFSQRLGQMQIVLQNQDNREHDLLDSDDYYQFQGGLTAAVKAQRGESPVTYFGDNAVPEQPKVRSLAAEIARVYRSRVVNPKWIAGVMRHGYKGAFEMSATIDYLFAYDATTGCVADHMYEGVANAYVLDSEVRNFVENANPWALRDMAERLLEAHQRGLWKGAKAEMVDQLRAIAHDAEGQIETGLSNIT